MKRWTDPTRGRNIAVTSPLSEEALLHFKQLHTRNVVITHQFSADAWDDKVSRLSWTNTSPITPTTCQNTSTKPNTDISYYISWTSEVSVDFLCRWKINSTNINIFHAMQVNFGDSQFNNKNYFINLFLHTTGVKTGWVA